MQGTTPNTCRLLLCRGSNSSLISRISHQQWPLWTVNISTAHSTAKFATNIWSFLVISNTCALPGTASWRPLRLHPTSLATLTGRPELVVQASPCRFKIHSIQSQFQITPRREDLARTLRQLRL